MPLSGPFDGAEAVNVSVSLTAESLAALEATMDESRFSYSIVGGEFANKQDSV